MAGAGATAQERRRAVTILAILVASTALVWVISAISVALAARGARDPVGRELVIPDGTAAAVRRGENPLEIPVGMSFVQGDVLIVRNRDAVAHTIGPYSVPPGGSTRIPLRPAAGTSFLCTIHPSGVLSIDVQPRGLDLGLTVFPTLALGPALGAVTALVWRVAARLAVTAEP